MGERGDAPVEEGMTVKAGRQRWTLALLGPVTWLLLGLAAVTTITSAAAELPVIGQLVGGSPQDVEVRGGYAYVAAGPALAVFDLRDVAEPALAALYEMPDYTSAEVLAVDDSHVYVGANSYAEGVSSALLVIDIAEPGNPHRVGSCPLPGTARAVAASGQHVYVGMGSAGLQVIDVGDRSAPIPVGTWDGSHSVWDVAIAGDKAFIAANYEGMRILDITTPASPIEVGGYKDCQCTELAVSGSTAYVVDIAGLRTDGFAQFRVLDVSTPTPVMQVGICAVPNAHDLAVVGDSVYLAGGEDGVRVLDVSDPAQPSIVSWLEAQGGVWPGYGGEDGLEAWSIAAWDSYACVGNPRAGLLLVDFSDLASPARVGFLHTFGASGSIAVLGDTAYVSGSCMGWYVVDFSDPASPLLLQWSDPGVVPRVAAEGDYLLVSQCSPEDNDNPPGTWVMDASSRSDPSLIGVCDGYWTGTPAFAGGYVYLPAWDRLRIVDLENPSGPVVVGSWDTPGSARGVALSGAYAYVADNDRGLRVIDVSVPSLPMEVGSYELPGLATAVAADASHAYVTCGPSGSPGVASLWVIDVSNPLMPVRQGYWRLPGDGYVLSVDIAGRYAYAAFGEDGLRVIDVSDPAHPIEAGHYPTIGWACEARVKGGRVYLTDGGWGVVCLQALPHFPDTGWGHWAFDAVEACHQAGIVFGFPNGSYQPDLVVTRGQMAIYIARALAGGDAGVPDGPPTPSFPDVASGEVYYKYVEHVKAAQVVTGYQDGYYHPEYDVDRGQMAIFVARAMVDPTGDEGLASYTPPGTPTFADVTQQPSDPYAVCYPYVEYIAGQGVTHGYPDGLYHPEYVVSRGLMAIYVARAFGLP